MSDKAAKCPTRPSPRPPSLPSPPPLPPPSPPPSPSPPLDATCLLDPISSAATYCSHVSLEKCSGRAKVRANGLWSACYIHVHAIPIHGSYNQFCVMSPVAAVCPSPPAAPPAPPLPDACSLQPIMNKKHYCINLPEESCADHAKVRVTGMWSACLISGERCSMSDVEVSCAPLPGAPPPPALPASPPIDLPLPGAPPPPALPASPPIDLPRYNDVGTCGPGHPGLAGNAIGECDPNGGSFCCSPYGYCGNTEAHCKCDDCIDYRPCYDETVCNGEACPTPPFGYSGPCDPGDEPPKARLPYRPLSLSAPGPPPFPTPILPACRRALL